MLGLVRLAVQHFDLQSMVLVEENHTGALRSTHPDDQMLYIEADLPRGRGQRGGLADVNDGRSEQRQNRREESS